MNREAPNGELAGQVAIVTGAGSGIGQAVAILLGSRGAKIISVDVDLNKAQHTAQLIAGAQAYSADISRSDEVDALLGDVGRTAGAPDILVHSAGVGLERPFLETSRDEWNRIIGIDLTGTFFCLQAVGRIMAARRYGRIVTLASTAGVAGGTGRAAYGAAKGGVIMLTRVLAVELAELNVTVNALAPGAIETPLVTAMHSSDTRINYTRSIPANRYGTPEEVAHAAAFLCSPGASYITGHVLAVDGGFLAAGVINRDGSGSAADAGAAPTGTRQ